MIRSIDQLDSILTGEGGLEDTNYESEEFEEESPTKTSYFYDEFEADKEKEKSADDVEAQRQRYEEQWEDEIVDKSNQGINSLLQRPDDSAYRELQLREKSAEEVETERLKYEAQWDDEADGALELSKTAEEVEADRLRYEEQWEDEIDSPNKQTTPPGINAATAAASTAQDRLFIRPLVGTSIAASTASFARDSLDIPNRSAMITTGIALKPGGVGAAVRSTTDSEVQVQSNNNYPYNAPLPLPGASYGAPQLPGASTIPFSHAPSLGSLNFVQGITTDSGVVDRDSDKQFPTGTGSGGALPDYMPDNLGYHVHVSSGGPSRRGTTTYSRVEFLSAEDSERLRNYVDKIEKRRENAVQVADVAHEVISRSFAGGWESVLASGDNARPFGTTAIPNRAPNSFQTTKAAGGSTRDAHTGSGDPLNASVVPVATINIEALKAEIVKTVTALMEEGKRKQQEEESYTKMIARRAVAIETVHGGLPRHNLRRMLDPVDVEAATGIPRSDPDFEYAAEFVDREEILVRTTSSSTTGNGAAGGIAGSGGNATTGIGVGIGKGVGNGDLRRPSNGFGLVSQPGIYLVKNKPVAEDELLVKIQIEQHQQPQHTGITKEERGGGRKGTGIKSEEDNDEEGYYNSLPAGAAASSTKPTRTTKKKPRPIIDSKFPKESLDETEFDFHRPDLLRVGTKSGPLWEMSEEVYATFLSDLIDLCRDRASSSTSVEEMAMHRILAEYVSACFTPSEKTNAVRDTMICAAEDVSLNHPFTDGVPRHLLAHLHKKRLNKNKSKKEQEKEKESEQNKENNNARIAAAAAYAPYSRRRTATTAVQQVVRSSGTSGDDDEIQADQDHHQEAEATTTRSTNDRGRERGSERGRGGTRTISRSTSRSRSRSRSSSPASTAPSADAPPPPPQQRHQQSAGRSSTTHHRLFATTTKSSSSMVRPATAPLPQSRAYATYTTTGVRAGDGDGSRGGGLAVTNNSSRSVQSRTLPTALASNMKKNNGSDQLTTRTTRIITATSGTAGRTGSVAVGAAAAAAGGSRKPAVFVQSKSTMMTIPSSGGVTGTSTVTSIRQEGHAAPAGM